MRSLSIVIPAYNEEKRLPSTLDTVVAYLKQEHANGVIGSWEVLVVNDGSRDRTAEIARAKAGSDPVRVLDNPGNRGKGYSVKHGMLAAQYEWALLSDADLSAPIAELPKLFAAADRDNAPVSIGSRAVDRSLIGNHQPAVRELGGRVFNLMVQLGTGLRLWDTQCGFKLFRRDAARAIFERLTVERFGFDVEALFIARKLGHRIVEVPVRWDHVDGTNISLARDSVDMFGDIVRVRWNDLRGKYRR